MADVYCAEDLQLGRRVALKVLLPALRRGRRSSSSASAARRRAPPGLQHQHVVVGLRPRRVGRHLLHRDGVPRGPLAQAARSRRRRRSRPSRAIDLAIQILRAARFAHRRGIIHRDLKPHNVIVDDEGRAKVTDFGIARAGASDMTQTGSIMGTAQYLSPEQAQGHAVSARPTSTRSGSSSTRCSPAACRSRARAPVTIALKQVTEQPVPPSQLNPAVSPALEAVVMRALEKDPARALPRRRRVHRRAARPRAERPRRRPARRRSRRRRCRRRAPALAREPVRRAPPPRGPDEDGSRWWAWLLGAARAWRPDRRRRAAARQRQEGHGARRRRRQPGGGAAGAARERASHSTSTFETSHKPPGEVIGQDPSGGTQAKKGSTVHLTVSSGPGQAAVPSVSGSAGGRRPRS